MDDRLQLLDLVDSLRTPYAVSFYTDGEMMVSTDTGEGCNKVWVYLDGKYAPCHPTVIRCGGDWKKFINTIEEIIIKQYAQEEE